MTTTDIETATQYSRGFDRGKYGNAYENDDWETWSASTVKEPSEAYHDGMLMGFFSSYELDEIDDYDVRDRVEALRVKYGDV